MESKGSAIRAGGLRMVGPPFNVIVEWRLFHVRQRSLSLSTVEIVVLVIAIVMFGGLGALLIRFERSEKDEQPETKK
jgi:hypothetical protein